MKNQRQRTTDLTLGNLQIGFKNDRDTLQAIWNLRGKFQQARVAKEKLILILIDLLKAFDSVDESQFKEVEKVATIGSGLSRLKVY